MQVQSTGTRLIPLTQGVWALVDMADFPFLRGYTWHAARNRNGTLYAVHSVQAQRRVINHKMHRVVMNAPDGIQVDHVNGDTLDNRRCNLRLATHLQNTYNRGVGRNNTSGYKGVVFQRHRQNWHARIGGGANWRHLGTFASPVDAAHAYDAAAKAMYGEFARLNFP